jgi:phosphate transport system protein
VLLTHMMADPGTVERALGLILISRALERIADHATNIAEELIFLVEGHVVRHRRVDVADTGSSSLHAKS